MVRFSLLFLCIIPLPSSRAATVSADALRAPGDEGTPKLADVLARYFQTEDARARKALVEDVRRVADGAVDEVAAALAELELWSEPEASEGKFEAPIAGGSPLHVSYRLPKDYSIERRFPLLVTIQKSSRRLFVGSGWAMRPAFPQWLPASATERFVHVSYFTPTEATFAASGTLGAEFRAVVREARRRFRIDSDRIFLHGEWEGGEAAWQVAMFQPHLFAGAILVASIPDLPYPATMYRMMAGSNLNRLPLLVATPVARGLSDPGDPRASARAETPDSGTKDGPDSPPPNASLGRLTAAGRAIELLAAETGSPWKVLHYPLGLTLESTAAESESAAALASFLGRSREMQTDNVSRVFRYPSQGDAGWVRQTKFLGDVWEAEVISIEARSQATDSVPYAYRVLLDKLASIVGERGDQSFEIRTHHCGGIDVLLRPGDVDWSKPVTVRINGARRHDSVVEPDIAAMLEEAYRDWEFQHPPWARLRFSIRSDGE
ncbi:MAG: hypothetical protein J5J06_18445 [Phycisphaerae bacterium]|nr:hypothetical protein [Phycisphaerae bacterium]